MQIDKKMPPMTKDKIQEILLKHIGTVNSFIDDNGYNRFRDCVEALYRAAHPDVSGREIRILRRAKEVSQEALAKSVGKTKSWLTKVENGERMASTEDVNTMVDYLKSL